MSQGMEVKLENNPQDGSSEWQPKRPSPLTVLRSRNIRLLWIGEAISLVGNQFYMIALPWLVLQLNSDGLAVGTILAITAGLLQVLITLVAVRNLTVRVMDPAPAN